MSKKAFKTKKNHLLMITPKIGVFCLLHDLSYTSYCLTCNKNKEKSQIIIILNYVFESFYVEYNYYNQFDLIILLAEHFCHLKNNPIMSFSIINSFILKKRNKISKFKNARTGCRPQERLYHHRWRQGHLS